MERLGQTFSAFQRAPRTRPERVQMPMASGGHGLVAVEVDPLGAGDLHHGAVQSGVCDQPHHPLRDQRRPEGRFNEEACLKNPLGPFFFTLQ